MKAVQFLPLLLVFFLNFCCFSQAVENFVAIGCYKDDLNDRALPDLIINHRISHPIIDWANLSKTIHSCAKAAQAKGYVYFAVQFWGECWAGHSGHLTYDKHGKSNNCERGVGKGHTNYVYRNAGVENECAAPRILNSEDRAITYSKPTTPYKCDEYEMETKPEWYRFEGKAGNGIASACPVGPTPKCATLLAGWMKGSHPQPSQGITAADVCFHNPGIDKCCDWKEEIKVRNCGRFYVYKLKPIVISCYYRYCGNGQ